MLCRNQTVPTAPRNLHVQLMNDQTAKLTWQPPRSNQMVVLGYKIAYSVMGDSYVEERRKKNELEFRTGTLR